MLCLTAQVTQVNDMASSIVLVSHYSTTVWYCTEQFLFFYSGQRDEIRLFATFVHEWDDEQAAPLLLERAKLEQRLQSSEPLRRLHGTLL